MKILKAFLFIISAFIASIAAISNAHITKPTSPIFISPVWLKYDCAWGTVKNPMPIIEPHNYVVFDINAIEICPADQQIVCVRKFEVTNPSIAYPIVQKPLNYDPYTDTYSFNPNYYGGTDAASQAFLAEIKCEEQ